MRIRKPYCSRIGRSCHAVCAVEDREQHLRAVEGRDRDEVEDHQDDVDRHEAVEHEADEARAPIAIWPVASSEPQQDRADDRQDQVRERTRGGDDRLAPSAAREVHRVDRRRLRPAEGEAPCETRNDIASRTPPTGSKWTIGLSVRRPNSLRGAVAEPIRRQRMRELVDGNADEQHDREDDDDRDELFLRQAAPRDGVAYGSRAEAQGGRSTADRAGPPSWPRTPRG